MQLNILFSTLSLMALLHTSLSLTKLNLLPVDTTVDLPTSTSTELNDTFPKRQTSLPWNDKIYKTINIFKGGLNGPPDYNCGGEADVWENWLDGVHIEIKESGVNCINTDCNTNFQVCNRVKKPQKRACTYNTQLTPSYMANGRCAWDVPGTETIYIWA
jgi:hypothetical protein